MVYLSIFGPFSFINKVNKYLPYFYTKKITLIFNNQQYFSTSDSPVYGFTNETQNFRIFRWSSSCHPG